MNARRVIGLVIGRELQDRLTNKGFVIGTVISMIIIIGLIAVPALLSDDGPASYNLGIVGAVPDGFQDAFVEAIELQGATVEVSAVADRQDAGEAVDEGDLDAVLIEASELMVDGVPDANLARAVELALQRSQIEAQLATSGLAGDAVDQVLTASQPLAVVDPEGGQDDGFLGWLLAFGSTILLFTAIATNAGSLLSGGIEEKSNRVIEVLLGTVRPWHLLAGKILALTALAMVQMGLLLGSAFATNAVVGAAELPPVAGALVLTSLVMTLLGFVFYAALYTVAGSLASSLEDAQSAAGPLGYTFAAAYFLVIFAVIPNPSGIIAQVMTFLPPTAPFAVPARVALGSIPGWQIAAGILVTLLGAALSVRLSGRLYAASVLAGGRVTWREAWQGEPVR